jgi:hypothetical protein
METWLCTITILCSTLCVPVLSPKQHMTWSAKSEPYELINDQPSMMNHQELLIISHGETFSRSSWVRFVVIARIKPSNFGGNFQPVSPTLYHLLSYPLHPEIVPGADNSPTAFSPTPNASGIAFLPRWRTLLHWSFSSTWADALGRLPQLNSKLSGCT